MEWFINTIRNRNGFSHDKLQDAKSCIRLLRLQPSNDHDHEIHGIMYTTPISSAPSYKALSYCWGENVKSHGVIVNGKPLGITSSLDTALRHLRHEIKPITLWIDQICINQVDLDEKNDQLPMMARIYSQAEQVLVWLGPAEGDSDQVMNLFAQVGQAIRSADLEKYCNRENWPTLRDAVARKDPDDLLWKQAEGVINLAANQWLPCLEAVANWGKRDWFGRVWVIQEFCFGAQPLFVCGHWRVPVDFVKTTRMFTSLGVTEDFLLAVRSLHGAEALQFISGHDPTPALFSARSWRQRRNGDFLLEILRTVYIGRTAKATEPVDRIFSLLSLATDRESLDSTSTRALVIGTGNLHILAYAQFPKDLQQLPTWVPDWRPNLRPSFYYYPPTGLEVEHLFNRTRNHSLTVREGSHEGILGLDGFMVDTIERVGDVWTDHDGSDPLHHLPVLAGIRFFCQLSAAKNQPIYASKQRRDEAEWRVPIADVWETRESDGQRAGERAKRAFGELHELMAWFSLSSSERETAGTGDAPDDHEPSMYRLSMAKITGMRPFLTSQGYVGLAPWLCCPGDAVVWLFGARVCSILRSTQYFAASTEKQYFYIGEAYCDGLMDGELHGRRGEETFYLV